ncbi:MAG: glycosyltransferase family 4 protein [Bacteroidetes bacterium]|nr:glycosyltransferase family 4 protein [Bacteroidota bacterium]
MTPQSTPPTDFTFVYFAPADIQVPRVDRQGVVHFCESVHRLGIPIELVTLGIEMLESEARPEHPLDLYRIRERFPVRTVPTSIRQRTQDNRAIHSALTRLRVNIAEGLRWLRRVPGGHPIAFFAKNYGPTLAFVIMRAFTRRHLAVFFEAHVPPRRRIHRAILNRTDGIVTNSYALGRDIVESYGIRRELVLGIHQGIDLELVEEDRISRAEARARFGFGLDEQLIVYAGKIYWEYREVEYILEAARRLPDDVRVVMVGGRADHVARYRERIEREGPANVLFTGFVAPIDVQAYLAAADVLVMYYPSGLELNKYRSPGKLFEYMAADRPIVTADYPVLHEVLGGNGTAVFVPADAPEALADALQRTLAHREESDAMARRAFEQVRLFSWTARARTVVDFMRKRIAARYAR